MMDVELLQWFIKLSEELHKPLIRKFEKQKVYSFLKAIFGVVI